MMHVSPKIGSAVNSEPLNLNSHSADISFNNVSFEYLPGQPILNDLTFTVPAGQSYAIVGGELLVFNILLFPNKSTFSGSGSGKSTIIRLLYRFMETGSGKISVGGKNITTLDIDTLRKQIAVVPQDCVLFHDTIHHNIKYGNLSAGDNKVEEAAKMAELHNSILDWPNGYQTQVGERGLKLSGGEKQRVAIARAILKDTPILIFDEATSSLDSITERGIMRALEQATSGRTSVIIAHRLSTVTHCDKILVLDKGRVVEEGAHSELLARDNSIYRELWETQNSADEKHDHEHKDHHHHHHHERHEEDGGCGGCGHAHH